MKKYGLCNIVLALVVALSFSVNPVFGTEVYAASIPKYTAAATDENVLAVLKKYDPNGYLFVKTIQDKEGTEPARWYSDGDSIIDEMNTTVHEACHDYSSILTDATYDFDTGSVIEDYGFHVADSTDLREKFDRSFMVYSNEMAGDVPGELRDRWDTYIGDNADEHQVANQFGVYGMMDEFNAYGWALNNDLCMYEYIKDTGSKKEALNWLQQHAPTSAEAYYEYKLWIHMYLKHVKDHYPDLYASIANNRDFINVYKAIDSRISSSIKQYKSITGSAAVKDYRKAVMKIIKSDDYKEIRKVLKGKGVDASAYEWKGAMDWTTINCLSFTEDGMKISWRNTDDSDGFEIYRKSSKTKFAMIKEVVKDSAMNSSTLTYYDKTIKDGGTYTYYIIPYQKNADGTKTYGEKTIEREMTMLDRVVIKNAVYKNGKILVTWKKYKGRKVEGYEIRFIKKGDESTYVDENGSTIESSTETTMSHGIYEENATSYTSDSEMGSGEYRISVRVFYDENEIRYFSPWSETLIVTVKE